MIRLFIAVDVPETIKRELSLISYGVRDAKWTIPSQFHCTLKFIGDVDGAKFSEIRRTLSSVKKLAFDVTLSGCGIFPHRGNPKILWIGFKESEELLNLHYSIQNSLFLLNIPRSDRKFHAHITLARFPEHSGSSVVAPFIVSNNLFKSQPFRVNEFHLYSSDLKREGAIHTIEETYPLI
jgi:2'-5' RNA ligase